MFQIENSKNHKRTILTMITLTGDVIVVNIAFL